MHAPAIPQIIQGGMGVAVSGWRLARAVSAAGQLGVVSGTALDVVLARRLQLGDPQGDLRRALEMFPYPEMAQRVLRRYFVSGGKAHDAPFRNVSMLTPDSPPERIELIVVANFVEVFLSREGHTNPVGINYLEKIQLPCLPSLFGAMLAGVEYVLMGAGIPTTIPAVLDALSAGEPAEIAIRIEQPLNGSFALKSRFDPVAFAGGERLRLDRPQFLAIVSSATLATMLARRASGRVDGFVVEGPTAGGHNAPPRGLLTLNARGEPVYGTRDIADLRAFRQLGSPFWLAGSCASPEKLAAALAAGAAGIQVGTAFAFCRDSDLTEQIKQQVLQMSKCGQCNVFTDPYASPTGFPFKVLELSGSLSDPAQFALREKNCDLGFLRQGCVSRDGTLCWRCPAEPDSSYSGKGGCDRDTVGRKCLCNALMANVGLGQRRRGTLEKPLVTCGDDVMNIRRFLATPEAASYSARDVLDHLLGKVPLAACSRSGPDDNRLA